MIILQPEKKVLQKHYVENIKSYVSNLKNIIDDGKDDVLVEHLEKITSAVNRIRAIQNQWNQWGVNEESQEKSDGCPN